MLLTGVSVSTDIDSGEQVDRRREIHTGDEEAVHPESGGTAFSSGRPLPTLRALAVLTQLTRLVLKAPITQQCTMDDKVNGNE